MAYDITYESDDLIIREITTEDKAVLEDWYHDKWHTDQSSPMKKEYNWFLEYELDPSILILIAEEKKTLHKPIGVIKFTRVNKKHVTLNGHIIGEPLAKGKGYSGKLIELAHGYIFNELFPKYICVEVDANNRGAVDTYIKAGYKINEIFEVNGRDRYFMRTLNKNYSES